MGIKNKVIDFVNKLPYVKNLYQENIQYKQNSCFPAGHFYSPIVSVSSIKQRETKIWNKAGTDRIMGIDLKVGGQIELVESLSKYYQDLPFKPDQQKGIRYNYENGFYSYTDGILLFSIIRHLKPRRIIEIGSGFSSAAILDTNEMFFDGRIELTFVEPYPERLYSLMTEKDLENNTVLESEVQSVDVAIFKNLEAGDILFIDSSHIVKTGSDVNHILFSILPLLQRGVWIHFHDIFFPFEYPKEWVFGGRNWNEAYFLKAFLMYNSQFEIQLFSDYLHKFHKGAFQEMPLSYKNTGGNLWLERK